MPCCEEYGKLLLTVGIKYTGNPSSSITTSKKCVLKVSIFELTSNKSNMVYSKSDTLIFIDHYNTGLSYYLFMPDNIGSSGDWKIKVELIDLKSSAV